MAKNLELRKWRRISTISSALLPTTDFRYVHHKIFSKCANGDNFRLSPWPFFSLDNPTSSGHLFFLNTKFRQSRKWRGLSRCVPLKNSRIAQMETNFHYLLGPSSPLTIQRLQLIYFSLIKNFANRANGDDFR